MNTRTMALIFLLAVLVVTAVVFVPMLLIWAVNTLFKTGIPVNWDTWAAMLLITAILSARAK